VFDDLNDYEVSIMNACELMANSGLRFKISGFGLDEWPLDIPYDLSVFMEELPGMLNSIIHGEEHEFYFYSQGIERTIIYSPQGELVELRCISATSWVPDPDVEIASFDALVAMLKELAIDFGKAITAAGGAISETEPFRSWVAGRVAG
jgi:hypothetical protein